MKAKILTASRTKDGAPRYWDKSGNWQADVQQAAAFTLDDDAQTALTEARAREADVCDPYLIKVIVEDDVICLKSQRESIRGDGAARVLMRLGYPSKSDDTPRAGEEA